jgi:hypothetical protein
LDKKLEKEPGKTKNGVEGCGHAGRLNGCKKIRIKLDAEQKKNKELNNPV